MAGKARYEISYLGIERHQTATKSSKADDKYMDYLTDIAAEVGNPSVIHLMKAIRNSRYLKLML